MRVLACGFPLWIATYFYSALLSWGVVVTVTKSRHFLFPSTFTCCICQLLPCSAVTSVPWLLGHPASLHLGALWGLKWVYPCNTSWKAPLGGIIRPLCTKEMGHNEAEQLAWDHTGRNCSWVLPGCSSISPAEQSQGLGHPWPWQCRGHTTASPITSPCEQRNPTMLRADGWEHGATFHDGSRDGAQTDCQRLSFPTL